MQFVAIDFETANHRPDSACQLAAVVVHEGNIVERKAWLIRPPRMFFSARNVEIHGIRPEHVADQPTLAEIWTQLHSLVDGQVLLAHNARFDIGVLVASLLAHDVACPNLEFSCTRMLARRAWPGQASYGLKPLGNWLGIDFRHHDALEDAVCCARIALAVAEMTGATSLLEMESTLRVTRGQYRLGHVSGPRIIGRTRKDGHQSYAVRVSDRWGFPTKQAMARQSCIDRETIARASIDQLPLADKRIMLLGTLRGMDWNQSAAFVESLGGICQKDASSETNYIIVCGGADRERAHQILSELGASVGQNTAAPSTEIRILSERQFLALLPAGKAAVRW